MLTVDHRAFFYRPWKLSHSPHDFLNCAIARSLPSWLPLDAISFPNNDPMASLEQAAAQAYYSDIAFASQLCGRFASEEGAHVEGFLSASAKTVNLELATPLAEAHELLERIVSLNTSVYPPPPDRLPEWPLHPALIRFDLPLQRMTTQFLFTHKWKPRFYVLRNFRLYYSNGKKGYADSHEGCLAFMRSNPEPDEHFCIDLRQWCVCTLREDSFQRIFVTRLHRESGEFGMVTVECCSTPVDGQEFAFEIKIMPPFMSQHAEAHHNYHQVQQHAHAQRVRTCHMPPCRLQRSCCLLLPMMPCGSTACAPSKLPLHL